MGEIQSIIEECKEIKRKLGYTNQYIAEQTGVPEGTVSRVFGSRQYNFKYETIQPIIAFLAAEDADGAAKLPNNDVIALYEDIVAGKNKELAELKAEHRKEIDALKSEHKAAIAELKREHQAEVDGLKNPTSTCEPCSAESSLCLQSSTCRSQVLAGGADFHHNKKEGLPVMSSPSRCAMV